MPNSIESNNQWRKVKGIGSVGLRDNGTLSVGTHDNDTYSYKQDRTSMLMNNLHEPEHEHANNIKSEIRKHKIKEQAPLIELQRQPPVRFSELEVSKGQRNN